MINTNIDKLNNFQTIFADYSSHMDKIKKVRFRSDVHVFTDFFKKIAKPDNREDCFKELISCRWIISHLCILSHSAFAPLLIKNISPLLTNYIAELERAVIKDIRLPIDVDTLLKAKIAHHEQSYNLNYIYTSRKVEKMVFHLATSQAESQKKELNALKLNGGFAKDGALFLKFILDQLDKQQIRLFDQLNKTFTNYSKLCQIQNLTQLYFLGATYWEIFEKVIPLLEKNDQKKMSESVYYQAFISLNQLKNENSVLSNSVIFNYMSWVAIDQIQNLQKGEWMWVPMTTKEHHMILEIEKGQDDYELRIFNVGEGAHYHCYDQTPTDIAVKPLVLENIKMEKLSYTFFEQIFWFNRQADKAEDVYQLFAKHFYQLEKIPEVWQKPAEDLENKKHPVQKYGTCAYVSLEVALFFHLTEIEKKNFEIEKFKFILQEQDKVVERQNIKIQMLESQSLRQTMTATPVKSNKEARELLEYSRVLKTEVQKLEKRSIVDSTEERPKKKVKRSLIEAFDLVS